MAGGRFSRREWVPRTNQAEPGGHLAAELNEGADASPRSYEYCWRTWPVRPRRRCRRCLRFHLAWPGVVLRLSCGLTMPRVILAEMQFEEGPAGVSKTAQRAGWCERAGHGILLYAHQSWQRCSRRAVVVRARWR